MAHLGFACEPPPDVDTDDCLPEYSYLFKPDILQGKVAFITGGGSGIGFRIAEILMRHGCQCVIASRNLERLTEASKKLSAATGQRCLPISLDVRQPQSISAAVDEALQEFEKIDILVNSEGLVLVESLGALLNIRKPICLFIDAMTKHLAVEWGPQRIRVISIAPGPISGTEGYRRLVVPGLDSGGFLQNIPLQRAGNKTEIAHSVLYLVSPLSSYVTGTTLVVDGGCWMTSENSFPSLLDFWIIELKRDK
ncbi:PREDICTED: peroxisomal 2,4-dienoyl-CoA reductase [Thamnophis sirtalis]|uniref:Peroxisomal 2,4-dienoyl-CoA reductase [(3E)-enoyl-CoA-producing] n=1 Tax=Thamnophis sirtalis TaxID=35019 RepID=A0A6I9XK17_9SAUR|nr:PREDICTED: peroxisomal 2,4-dienoyl-CoA reductase [Thamnophis sirtalis]